MIVIKNARILTMSEQNYENGYLIINNGKIIEIGEMTQFDSSKMHHTKVIDANAGLVVPGFIDAHCHIGINVEDKGIIGDDSNEVGNPVVPNLNVIDGINPDDIAFSEARSSGVTMVVVCPGSVNVVGGQCAAIKTAGRTVDEMIVKSPVAVKVAMGENPIRYYSSIGASPTTRMGVAHLLRESLNDARDKNASRQQDDNDAMIAVINNRIPLKIHVHRADDIMTAIRIAKEFNIHVTLDHCTQGNKVIEEIKKSKFPVLIGPMILFRDREEINGHSIENYVQLIKSGIECAIITDHPVVPIKYTILHAAELLKYGINENEIIKMLTIVPAKILGVEKEYGSISVGKRADIVIFEKPKFGQENFVKYTLIDGNVVYEKEV